MIFLLEISWRTYVLQKQEEEGEEDSMGTDKILDCVTPFWRKGTP